MIFDLGFGGYNFSWSVAEKSFAQDLIPHTISSDLQQFNVVRPVKSLANVMSAMLRLGMKLPQVIERVTSNPAKAISLTDRAGSLKPGMPADITVFRVDSGEYEITDCYTRCARPISRSSRSSRSRTASGSMLTWRLGRTRTTGSSRSPRTISRAAASKLDGPATRLPEFACGKSCLDLMGGVIRGAARHRKGT